MQAITISWLTSKFVNFIQSNIKNVPKINLDIDIQMGKAILISVYASTKAWKNSILWQRKMFTIITVIFKGTLLSSRSSFSAFPILFGKAWNEKLEAEYSTLKMVIFGLKFNFVTKNIIVNIWKGSFFNLSPSCRPMHFGNFAQFTKRGNSSYWNPASYCTKTRKWKTVLRKNNLKV